MSECIRVTFVPGSPDGDPQNTTWVKTPQIIFEDDELVVVSKPRQMHSVSHKIEGESSGEKRIILEKEPSQTLARWLSDKFPACENASPSPLEGGLVQRLDFFTSGLLVAAKTRSSWQKLRESQVAGGFVKRYQALVEGDGDPWRDDESFTVSQPLYYKKGGKRAYYSRKGNKFSKFPAESKVSMLRMFRDNCCGDFRDNFRNNEASCSLVEVESSNLHRHQVRAHLSWAGSPLVGDVLYNARHGLESYRSMLLDMLGDNGSNLDGFLLHASYLKFPHPSSGDPVECIFSFPYLREDCSRGM